MYDFSVPITVIISVLGVFIAFLGFQNAKLKTSNDSKKDIELDTKDRIEVAQEVKYISKGVDDIKSEFRSFRNDLVSLGDRLTRAEESLKSLHKRVDKLEKNKGEL